MTVLLQDVRYALRQLRRSPAFTAVALVTLALGIGANTAIFSVVYGILLRPLPYEHPERIVELCELNQGRSDEKDLTYRQLQFLQSTVGPFQSLAAFTNVGFNLVAGGTAQRVNGLHVSSEYFHLLRIQPLLGRTFTPDEDRADGSRVAILSEGLWRRMGSDRSLIGRSVLLDGAPFTVVGVMPGDFERLNTPLTHGETEVWAPLALVRQTAGSGENLETIGRLKDGISLGQARSQVATIGEAFRNAFPGALGPASSLSLEPYQAMLSTDLRTILLILFGAVVFVLLIACANIANLLLGRAVVRGREMAIRTSLGGSRIRLFRQLITESLLLSSLGAVAGVLLADWGLKIILAFSPTDLPRIEDIRLDLPALAFAMGLALATGLVFGLVPAFRVCRHNLNDSLKEGTGRAGPGKRSTFFRSGLVVTEIGLALMLLTGAVLLTETFWRVLRTDPGFDPSHVLSMQVWISGSKYNSTGTAAKFYDSVVQKIEYLPGVQSAAVSAAGLPLERGGNMPVEVTGRATPDAYGFRMVTPGYFRTMSIPLKAGRFVDLSDREHAAAVAVVSESFARRIFQGEKVIGQHLRVGNSDREREIVGVVGDVKSYLDEPAEPTVFVPIAQAPFDMMRLFESWFATSIVVRTAIDPLTLSRSVQEQLHAADPTVASGHVRTMEQVRSSAVALRQFNMILLASFAALAAALAALGIYGVMAYSVRQRTREIGLRMAFGAQRRDVLRMIYREALLLAGIGLAMGTAGAMALNRFLERYLYEVKPGDPVAFVTTVALLAAMTMLASAIPARRATRIEPVVALRYE